MKIELGRNSKEKNRIPYNQELIKKIKSVSMKNWNPEYNKFSTHLLERVVDLRYIKEILEHKNSKIMEFYTHASKASLAKIENPLDKLMKGK